MKVTTSIFGKERDVFFMKQALKQAYKAMEHDEVPVGAVVVSPKGAIIARGYNLVMKKCTQLAHAEARAIEKAGRRLGDWRLQDCWLYVTLEPCSMCINLIKLSRLKGVVYGAASPLFGYHLDNDVFLRLYKKGTIEIIGGVCSEESIGVLRKFFQKKRVKR